MQRKVHFPSAEICLFVLTSQGAKHPRPKSIVLTVCPLLTARAASSSRMVRKSSGTSEGELSQQLLQFIDIAARDGNGIVAVTHHELHGTGIGGDLLSVNELVMPQLSVFTFAST